MTIGPYTITTGNLIPYSENVATNQIRQEAADYSTVIVDRPQVRFLKGKFKVPRAEADDIERFLTWGVRFAATAFTVVDDFGTSWSVRYWDRVCKKKFVAADVVLMELTFRVEPVTR